MKEDTSLKNKFFKSNRELIDLFDELHENYESLQKSHESLKTENANLISKNVETSLEANTKFGIINLSKLNGEAVFDAINHFNKSCPYCKTDLYGGHIRNNYEIDHFFPIAKGGQDVPWNLLPICRNCNRKKRDILPFEYLDESIYNECSLYLEGVLFKITNSHEDKLQRDEITQNLLMSLVLNKLTIEKIVAELQTLFNISKTSTKDVDESLKLVVIFNKDIIENCTNTPYFSVTHVMTFQEVIARKMQRSEVKKILIELYGEPDKSQRFYKRNRKEQPSTIRLYG